MPERPDVDLHPHGPGSHALLDDPDRMPECHPIKGDETSMTYHRPDSDDYEAIRAEVWFVSPSAAEAAGFDLAGSYPDDSASDDFEPGGVHHPCNVEQVVEHGVERAMATVNRRET